jgi:hypothetical protein
MPLTGMILIKYHFEGTWLHWNRCLFSAIWCRNPKVEELNKAWKQHITKWTNQAKINKKILLLSLGTATWWSCKEPWTESQNTMNTTSNPNPISNLNSKVLVCRRICLKWYADEYHKKKKIMSTTHHRINQLSKPLKMVQISKVN